MRFLLCLLFAVPLFAQEEPPDLDFVPDPGMTTALDLNPDEMDEDPYVVNSPRLSECEVAIFEEMTDTSRALTYLLIEVQSLRREVQRMRRAVLDMKKAHELALAAPKGTP
jgi:hypothetical protein